jgi:predicted nucleic acid-binding protein
VILVDTSAWIEYLRATESDTDRRLTHLLQEDADIATTDVVVMEVLAGAHDDEDRRSLQRLLYGDSIFLGIDGPLDYEAAADLFRLCRAGGETIRRLTDCLIAIVAMRAGAEILHRDRDFDAIARHLPLKIAAH